MSLGVTADLIEDQPSTSSLGVASDPLLDFPSTSSLGAALDVLVDFPSASSLGASMDALLEFGVPPLLKGKQIARQVPAGEGATSDIFDPAGIQANAYGRGIFAAGLFDAATVTSVFAAASIPTAKLVDTFLKADGSVPLSGNLSAGSNKITSLANGTAAGDAVNRGQLDAAVLGLNWQAPVAVRNLIGNRTVADINADSPIAADAYVVTDAGTLTLGSLGVVAGDLVEFNGTVWVKIVAGSGGFVAANTRALVTAGTPISPLVAGDKGKIATFGGASNTPTFQTSLDGWAVLVNGEGAQNENQSYVFDGVVPTGAWVQIAGTQSSFFNATQDKSKFVGSPTSGDDANTGLTVVGNPTAGGYVGVSVNGLWTEVGNGVKTKDCYFSSDGGTTAKAYGSVTTGDTLFWNGNIYGTNLATSDRIDFHYVRS